jgi:phytoene desaturase
VIRTGAEVSEIVVEQGRVTGVSVGGAVVPADLVVSNADVAHTYGHLLRAHPRRRWTDRRLARMDYTMSCFLLYLGVRRTYPRLAHHTLILTQRYRALLADIFDRKVLADDFSMYLHAPTKTDPTMAPPGCESLYVLVPVPNLQAGIDWDRTAETMTARVLGFLEAWGLEGLRDHLDVVRTFTPADFARDLTAWHGNAFGPEPRLLQTAYFRPHNRSEEVRGLYLVGAGTHPGAGVPGVLLSAEATTACIRDDLRLVPPDAEPPLSPFTGTLDAHAGARRPR